jgi:hypothetical protein
MFEPVAGCRLKVAGVRALGSGEGRGAPPVSLVDNDVLFFVLVLVVVIGPFLLATYAPPSSSRLLADG